MTPAQVSTRKTDSDIRKRGQFRHTKIVATIGPAISSYEAIGKMLDEGVNVFRLNFSHGLYQEKKKMIDIIRGYEMERGQPIGILADLQGPKIRIGRFEQKRIDLQKGQNFTFDMNDKLGDETRVCLPHPEIFAALNEGDIIRLDDGRVQFKIFEKTKTELKSVHIYGTSLSDQKGVNVPNVKLDIAALTDKDKEDLQFALEHQVDWVALSFVQKAADIEEAKALVKGRAKVMAKLEKPAAIDDLRAIVNAADGIMIARGDLGIELSLEAVPAVQKKIIRFCRKAAKPVIVATQMLESMISAPLPTRAETSDVATAIYDGTDAIMLSGETAVGAYAELAVGMMHKIALHIEKDVVYRKLVDSNNPKADTNPDAAMTAAARQIAETVGARLIANYTTSGSTALRTARERPDKMILCLTSNLLTARQLTLSYGTYSIHTADVSDFDEMVKKACTLARNHKLGRKGDKVVITAGVPFGTPGITNTVRIAEINDETLR